MEMSRNFWEGERVRLRPLSNEDLPIIYAQESDSESIRVYEPGIHPMRSLEQLQARHNRQLAQPGGHNVAFAIENINNRTLVGTASLRDWDNRHGTFSFAVRIYQDHQRKGYAHEAITIILRYGFYELRCQKVNSVTIEMNKASIRLHEKLGFTMEGRLRRNVFTNGQFWDELLFGMTREEFESSRG